jgi:hypothetical protein
MATIAQADLIRGTRPGAALGKVQYRPRTHHEGPAKVRRRLSQNVSRIGGLNTQKERGYASR